MPAIALAAAFPEVAIAIGAVLAVWALTMLLARPLTWALQQFPPIAGAAAGFVANAIGSASAWAYSVADGAVGALSQTISGPLASLQQVIVSIVGGIEGLLSGQLTLAGLLNSGLGSLGAWIHTVEATAASAAARVAAVIPDLASLRLAVTALIAVGLPGAIAAALSEARAFAVSQVTALDHLLGQRIGAVEAELHAAEAAATTAVASAEAVLEREIGVVERTFGDEIGKLSDLVTPLAAAGLLTLVPTLVRELETLKDECITPTCNALKPQIPTLSALGDIATLMLVGGFVGEAIANPAGTAAATAAVTGAVEGAAGSLFELFTGRAA